MEFDGKLHAQRLLDEVKEIVSKSELKPHMASIVVGDIGGGLFYQNLKKKAAESIGATLEIISFPETESKEQLIALMDSLNNDQSVTGIMIQLPLPDKYNTSDKNSVIKAIDPDKDVDGMRPDSPYVAPVVLACAHALEVAPLKEAPCKVAIVGYKGFVGEKIMKYFAQKHDYVSGFDKGDDLRELVNFDIIIACTGRENLIEGEMIREGAVLIDTGAPKAEFTEDAIKKAGFVTPVPGGIGPLTIAYLIHNLIS